MTTFDVSRDWVILVPPEPAAVWKAGSDLARIIGLLREQAGLPPKTAGLVNAFRDAPDETVPVIILNAGSDRGFENGFSWRMGRDRLEIFGNSDKGLCNGVYGFLAALGVRWPQPDWEDLPAPDRCAVRAPGVFPLENAGVYRPSEADPAKRRRLVITEKTPLRSWEQVVLWAVHNRIDALVLPLKNKAILGRRGALVKSFEENREQFLGMAKDHGLTIEAGGWQLSLLVPRKNFFFHRELFRMEMGRRVKDYNFCPTNPNTIVVIKREAERLFRENPGITVFHLWPDRKHESFWCSCPICRAFTKEEQNRIAVNTAADVLAETVPESCISYYENSGGSDNILARRNMFKLRRLPGEAGAEEDGLFLAE